MNLQLMQWFYLWVYMLVLQHSQVERETDTSGIVEQKLSEFAQMFLQLAEGNYAAGTIERYNAALKKFIELVGDFPLSQYSAYHWQEFKSLRLKEVQPTTCNIDCRQIRAAFNTAVKWKLISANPFAGEKLAAVPDTTPKFFTEADLNKLLTVIGDTWLKDVVVFAVCTGLRRGELCSLRFADIDFEKRTLTVQSHDNFKTKHGKRRTIPLNDEAVRIFERRKNEAADSYYVFTVKGKQINDESLSQRFRRCVKRCNFSQKGLHFHSLRATFASILVQKDTSIYAVSKMLGHSDVKLTMKHYAYLSTAEMHSEVNKISLRIK